MSIFIGLGAERLRPQLSPAPISIHEQRCAGVVHEEIGKTRWQDLHSVWANDPRRTQKRADARPQCIEGLKQEARRRGEKLDTQDDGAAFRGRLQRQGRCSELRRADILKVAASFALIRACVCLANKERNFKTEVSPKVQGARARNRKFKFRCCCTRSAKCCSKGKFLGDGLCSTTFSCWKNRAPSKTG